MIITSVNFFSTTLGVRSHLNVILPQREQEAGPKSPHPPYRTLYLLHGLSDDHTAWQRWTSIERYVEGLNMAVVMPAVQRSFYTDMAHGGKYWTYISEEVTSIAHEIFHLSDRREDTFVAGLSMGGYGAFKLALSHPDRFAAAASLSGAVDVHEVVSGHGAPEAEAWLEEMRNIFGDLTKVPGSPDDLFFLAEEAAKSKHKSMLFQYCGTEDFLYADNLRFRDHLRTLPLDLTYEEGPGDHNWKYWDLMIQKVLAWLPLQ
jgi:S-formylglutathione hydrolase FrmB